jgi:tRNA (guanine37-N1)-methyltransferase
MRIDILTLFPEIFQGPFSESIMKRAISQNLVQVELHNIRDYSDNKHKKVDDYPFGGGAGMVMGIQPIDTCLENIKSNSAVWINNVVL